MKASGAQMAQILGVSAARVSQLKAEEIIATESDGKFDVPKSVQAYIAHLETGALSPELAAHRAKLIEQQTRRLRLANDKQERHLMPADDVRQGMMAIIATFTQALDAIPGRLAATLAAETNPAQIHAKLKAELHAARTLMGTKLNELADEAAQQ
jgi:hypothetical protein